MAVPLPNPNAPTFAPQWTHQGMCPHIAYTTVDEAVSHAAWFYNFTLAIERGSYSDVGSYSHPPGTVVLRAPLFEWMVAQYSPITVNDMWHDLEWRSFEFSASSEGDGDWMSSVTGEPSATTANAVIYRT